MEKLLKVTDIKITVLKSNPPMLWIACFGFSSTPNWDKIQLSKYEYIDPPQDGIMEFDLIGNPNGLQDIQMIYPVISEPYLIKDIPNWLRGIKIYSKTNFVVERLPYFVYGKEFDPSFYAENEEDDIDQLSNSEKYVFGSIQDDKDYLVEKCQEHTLLRIPINVEAKVTGRFPNYKFYRRTVYSITFLRFCYSNSISTDLESEIDKCLKIGLVAAGGVIASGGIPLAFSTFKSSFVACCIASLGNEILDQITFKVDTRTERDAWRRI